MSEWFDDLSVRLRDRGVPEERVQATVADLRAYLQEAGTDAEAEFGPAADFAQELSSGAAHGALPAADAETWRFSADLHTDEELLNRFGDEGWEVEDVDPLRRFVCRRDRAQPQRWEYRRELVGVDDPVALAARLAPDGWEPCGHWAVYQWFKRPKAASVGPAAALGTPPEARTRRRYRSRRFYQGTAVGVTILLLVGALRAVVSGDAAEGAGTVVGMITGGLVPLAALAAWSAWRNRTLR